FSLYDALPIFIIFTFKTYSIGPSTNCLKYFLSIIKFLPLSYLSTLHEFCFLLHPYLVSSYSPHHNYLFHLIASNNYTKTSRIRLTVESYVLTFYRNRSFHYYHFFQTLLI